MLGFCTAHVAALVSPWYAAQLTLMSRHISILLLSQVLAPRGRFSIELYMSYLKLVGQVHTLNCTCK